MRKKVENKLILFFELDCPALKNYVKELDPQEIGEIRQLIKIKKKELFDEIKKQKELVQKNHHQLDLLTKMGEKLIKETEKIEKIFDQVFYERKKNKLML